MSSEATKQNVYQGYKDKSDEIIAILKRDGISLVEALGILEVTKFEIVNEVE